MSTVTCIDLGGPVFRCTTGRPLHADTFDAWVTAFECTSVSSFSGIRVVSLWISLLCSRHVASWFSQARGDKSWKDEGTHWEKKFSLLLKSCPFQFQSNYFKHLVKLSLCSAQTTLNAFWPFQNSSKTLTLLCAATLTLCKGFVRSLREHASNGRAISRLKTRFIIWEFQSFFTAQQSDWDLSLLNNGPCKERSRWNCSGERTAIPLMA